MDNLSPLHQVFFGNTVLSYLIAAAIIVVGIVVLQIIKRRGFSRLKERLGRRSSETAYLIVKVIERTVFPLLHLTILYIALSTLDFGATFRLYLHNVMMVVVIFFAIRTIVLAIRAIVTAYLRQSGKTEDQITEINGLLVTISIFIWAIGLVFMLGNLGYDITTIIAGLGIGGIAIALAAQAVLGDFFSYFVIFFDKPFEVGDFIHVDGLLGTIEHVGIKTTRVRELVGDELIFPNKNLVNSRIHNFSRIERRRITFEFGVVKTTKLEELRAIPEFVNEIIKAHPKALLVRGHFTSFGDFSFRFAFTYYVLDPDYTVYLDVQQALNLQILEELEKRGIALAYPTQNLLFDPKYRVPVSDNEA